MKIRLVSAVWGAEFARTYLCLAVPTLLAPGNLPTLGARHSVVYTIYTTPEDAAILEAAPIFQKLTRHFDVRISTFSLSEIDAGNFASHADLWARGFDLARRNRENFFLIIPDMLYGQNALSRWAQKLEEGYKAVYSPGPQVVLETILAEIAERFPDRTSAIALDEVILRDMLVRHLHPIPITMDRKSPRHTGHAEYDIRSVPGSGIVLRVLSSHPFCIDPSYFTTLEGLNPCDHLDKLAFEPIGALSAEPLYKHVSWYYRPEPLGEAGLTQLGFWWRGFAPPSCVCESEHVYDFVLRDDEVWKRGRSRAVAAGRFFRAQLAAATLCARLFLGLEAHKLHSAARFLAAAVLVARARRVITLRGDERILVPTDSALAGGDGAWAWRLIADGKKREVAELLRDHIIFTDAGGVARTLNGRTMDEVPGSAQVIDSPISIGGFSIYVVNRVLRPAGRPTRSHPINARRRAAFTCEPELKTVAEPFRPTRRDESFSLPAFGVAFYHPNTLVGGGAPAIFRSRMARRLLKTNRLHRAFRLMSKVPGLRRAAGVAKRALNYTYRYGLKATQRRVRGEIATRLKPITGSHLRASVGKPGARSQSVRLAEVSPTENALIAEVLRSVRLLRGLDAIEEVLDHYERNMLADAATSAPLAFARALRQDWLADGAVHERVENALREVLVRQPDCAEAHIELGYLLLDQGRTAEAKAAFDIGSRTHRFERSPIDARAEGAVQLAAILAAEGKWRGAADAYRLAFSLQRPQTILHYRYAEALRHLGDIAAAKEQFTMAMNASHRTWVFPKTGRDASRYKIHLSPPRLAVQQTALVADGE